MRKLPNFSYLIKQIFPFKEGNEATQGLLKTFKLHKLEKGKEIFKEGITHDRNLFFTLKGQVAIVIDNKNIQNNLQEQDDLKSVE